uniref:PNPLA domain-containing protein n=1 Tax=Spongospora subterranea TaxID=70186 RepID=A0A0H5R9D5_9EUKA|eukprot:CRZ10292.1 hypothetical protein [Spongospora subterranea]
MNPTPVKALVNGVVLLAKGNVKFFGWILAPDLLIRVICRHILLLLLLYSSYFAYGRLGRLFQSQIMRVKHIIAWYLGKQDRYLSIQNLKNAMDNAKDYDEWRDSAAKLDLICNRMAWKDVDKSDLYDYRKIRDNLNTLRQLVDRHDIEGLMRFLRSGLQRNFGGIGNPKLYGYLLSGTKTLVEDYTREVVRALNLVANERTSPIQNVRKLAFFMETRHSFGRSALLLSGGSTLGLYHSGVIKALVNKKVLPRIISGSSVGALFAAMVGTRNDDELEELSRNGVTNLDAFPSNSGSLWRKVMRLWRQGHVYDMTALEQCVRDNVGNFSFQEAYARTGRILNISVCAHGTHLNTEPLLLNYLTAPAVLISSAVCASCAIPWVFNPVELMSKEPNGQIVPLFSREVMWLDGSVQSDLPMRRLAEMFNVNHFIVSQVNPHVVPVLAPQQMLSASSSIMARAITYLGGEVRDLVLRLGSLVFSEGTFSRLQSLAFQSYVGDITLYPKPSFRAFLTLLENPSRERFDFCMQESALYTWRHMALIREHCDIEFELDACVRQLRAGIARSGEMALSAIDRHHPSENLGSRIRSWSADQFQVFRQAEESSIGRATSTLHFPAQASSTLPRLTVEPTTITFSPTSPEPSSTMAPGNDDDPGTDDRLSTEQQEVIAAGLDDVDMMALP